jgi:hypothetical protein
LYGGPNNRDCPVALQRTLQNPFGKTIDKKRAGVETLFIIDFAGLTVITYARFLAADRVFAWRAR